MSQQKIVLETAQFLDAVDLAVPRSQAGEILRRFLLCCYEEVGKAPHLLDGADLSEILAQRLPTQYGRKESLAEQTPLVLESFLDYLTNEQMVPHAFELQQSLAANTAAFLAAVERGAAVAQTTPSLESRGHKIGRNDPCPCGSGKKFKKCCAKLGRDN